MNPNPIFQQPTDQQALALAHAIALTESGHNGVPNYNAVGDAGTSKGAYQWQPGNFAAAAQEAGLDPSDFSPANQDKVAYYQVKKYKDQGLDPGQIASVWNSGGKDNWKDHSGTTVINGQAIHYDTPAYVNKVKQNYQLVMGQGGQQGIQPPAQDGGATGSLPGYPAPVAPAPYQAPVPAAGQQQGSGGGGLLGAAKAVGNFLFPIAGDLYHDVKGDSSKTVLQQVGDAGLSALPFIPGLGEVGEGARAGVGAAELGVDAARGTGLAGKILGSTVGKGALTGYGAGVASNLSQGEGVGQSLMPNANTIGGTVLGGAAPAVLGGLGGIAKKVAGISPQIENELTSLGAKGDPADVNLYDQYINAAKTHATDVRAKAPLTMAADELDNAAGKITALTKAAGTAVGEAKKAGANLDFKDAPHISENFAQDVAERFGLKLTPLEEKGAEDIPTIHFGTEGSTNGTKFTVHPIAGSMREVEPGVASRVARVAEQLSKLPGASVKQASEIIHNLNELVDFTKTNAYGKVNDPLEAVIKHVAGDINNTIRQSSPEIAQANDTFSALKGLQEEISGMAGKNLQKGELLMRRVFSGDKSGDVNDLFAKIKDITGVDLIKHAVLAKHAIQSFGSQADKTLLEQIMEGAVSAHSKGLLSGLMGLGQSAARSTFANPGKIGRDLIKGGGNNGLLSNWFTKGAIEASRGVAPATGN